MPFTAVPATIKVSVFGTMDGQQVMNRFYVSIGATLPSESDCQTIANIVGAWWTGNVQALVPEQVELRLVEARSVAEENGPVATFSAGLPAAGTLVQSLLPNNVSLAVSLRTGLAGRSARGRWFWYGLTEGQVALSEVDAGTAASIVGAMDNLLSDINGASAEIVIVSFFSGGGPRVGGPVKFIVTDMLLVDTVVDSQRRRLPGRGS
jgi:hypothetical protein